MSGSSFQKAIIILTSTLISLYIYLSYQIPVEYSISLYQQLPEYSLAVGISIIFLSISGHLFLLCRDRHPDAIFALVPLLVQLLIVAYLPNLLGYQTKLGDNSTHFGIVSSILRLGFVPESIIYPGYHILVASLAYVTDLIISRSMDLIGLVGVSLYILFILIIISRSNINIKYISFYLLFTVSVIAVPAQFGYKVAFIMLIYLWLRTWTQDYTTNWLVITIILMGGIWIYHPMPAVAYGILIVLTVTISQTKLTQIIPTRNIYIPNIPPNKGLVLFIIYVVLGYLWTLRTEQVFKMGVLAITDIFAFRSSTPQTASISKGQISKLINDFGFTWIDITWLLFQRRSLFVLTLAMAGIGVLISSIGQRGPNTRYVFPLIIAVAIPVFAVLSFVEALFSIVGRIQFGRFARPALTLAPPAIAVFAMHCSVYVKKYLSKEYLMIMLISTSIALSGFMVLYTLNSHGGPTNFDTNKYTTDSELEAMNWYFKMKSRNIKTITLWYPNSRYASIILSAEERSNRKDELQLRTPTKKYRAPKHFGNGTTLGSEVGHTYYIERKRDRLRHTELFEAWNQFNRQDFNRLRADTTVNRIYANGNGNISIVYSN